MKHRLYYYLPFALVIVVSLAYAVWGVRSAYRLYPGLPGYAVHATDGTPGWAATWGLVTQGVNPYSKQGQAIVETFYFGRPLNDNDLAVVQDKHSFVYPLYVTFLFLPFVSFDLAPALALLWFTLFLAYVLSVLLWFRLVVPGHGAYWLVLLTLCLLIPHAWYGLQNRQPTLWIFLLLTGVICGMFRRSTTGDFAAGALFIWSFGKPQSAILVLLYAILFYTVMRRQGLWAGRWFWFGLGATGMGLFVVTNLIVPGWIPNFVGALNDYRDFAGTTGAEALFGSNVFLEQFAVAITTLIWLGMIVYMIRHPQWRIGHLITLAYAMILQTFVFPTHLYNFVFGIPILLLAFRALFKESQSGVDFLFTRTGGRVRGINLVVLGLVLVAVFTLAYYWLGIVQDIGIGGLTTLTQQIRGVLPWRVYYFPPLALALGGVLFLQEIVLARKTPVHQLAAEMR